MSSDYPEAYTSEYGHIHTPRTNLKSMKERIKGLEDRILLLKEIKKDGDARLSAQDAEIAERNREIDEMKRRMENDLQMNDKTLSDAALSVRTRERKIINLNDQQCKLTMNIQRLQWSKHQVVADAKKEVREEMRAAREQKRAALDIQHTASGRSSYNSSRHIVTSRDMGRRTPSSGSFFARASTGGGSGSGAANGGHMGRPGK